jgi:hypothetical protein
MLIGHTSIAARVYRGLSVEQVADMRLQENLQRKDMTVIEEARAIEPYTRPPLSLSAAEIGRRLHMSPDWAQKRLGLLRLTPELLEIVPDILPVKQAELLAKLPRPLQIRAAIEVLDFDGSSIGDALAPAERLTRIVADWRNPSPDAKMEVAPEYDARRIVDNIAPSLQPWAARWPQDDAYADRPACATCMHNTAVNKALAGGTIASVPRCFDEACYRAKADAWKNDAARLAEDADQRRQERSANDRKAAALPLTGRTDEARRDRLFPDTNEEKHAVAMYRYGEGLHKAIFAALDSPRPLKGGPEAATALMSAALVMADLNGIENFSLPPAPEPMDEAKASAALKRIGAGRLACDIAPRLAEAVPFGADHLYLPAYQACDKRVLNVPLPPAAVALIDCLEALCKRWKIKHGLARPAESQKPIAAKPAAKTTAKKTAKSKGGP